MRVDSSSASLAASASPGSATRFMPTVRRFALVAALMGLLLGAIGVGLTKIGRWMSNFGDGPALVSAADTTPDASVDTPRRRRRAPPPPPAPILNSEGVPVCVPTTCATALADCGTVSDGCGNKLDCGGCSEGYHCGGENSHACVFTCEPLSCKEKFADCGEVDDGCGTKIKCGSCKAGDTCGGGGIANECGKGTCQPITCRERDLAGGRFSDGCGGVIDC